MASLSPGAASAAGLPSRTQREPDRPPALLGLGLIAAGRWRALLTQTAGLLSVASASPPHVLRQDEVLAAARAHFGPSYPEFERLSPVFANAGIETRQSVQPLAWHRNALDWPGRTAAYLEGADALFLDAARKALERAGLEARAVDTVVTASSTGIATPSLEARAMAAMGFR